MLEGIGGRRRRGRQRMRWLDGITDSMDVFERTPGVGSDHELLIAKFRVKLKKAQKTTRPFRYDLNQILSIIQWE